MASPALVPRQPVLEVKIDNQRDAFATIVSIEYGDRLGDMLETILSLKALKLNIKRAKISGRDRGVHRFYLTDDMGEKIVKSSRLEEIRLTILSSIERLHPDASDQLAWGTGGAHRGAATLRDGMAPLGVRKSGVTTQIEIREVENGLYSELVVHTVDRPGLLTDIVRILKDISLNVVSAEVDTIGSAAFDKFNVTYHGEPLDEPMQQLAINALQYYLSQMELDKEWCESY